MTQTNIAEEYLNAIKYCYETYDKDLTLLVSLSALSLDPVFVRKIFAMTSHLQNIRSSKKTGNDYETYNKLLVSSYMETNKENIS